MASLDRVLAQLNEERARIEKELGKIGAAIAAVEKLVVGIVAGGNTVRRGRRKMSAAGRRRIAAAQRARWAKVHGRGRRRMSAAGRRRIAAAQRARWAKLKGK